MEKNETRGTRSCWGGFINIWEKDVNFFLHILPPAKMICWIVLVFLLDSSLYKTITSHLSFSSFPSVYSFVYKHRLGYTGIFNNLLFAFLSMSTSMSHSYFFTLFLFSLFFHIFLFLVSSLHTPLPPFCFLSFFNSFKGIICWDQNQYVHVLFFFFEGFDYFSKHKITR